MPYTRLSLDGYGAKRAGSFAGKEASTTAIGYAVQVVREPGRWLDRLLVYWRSDADGYAESDCLCLNGRLHRLATRPSPSFAPTDNYDVALEDRAGEDQFQGLAANRDTANIERVFFYRTSTSSDWEPVSINGHYRFKVRNAGVNMAGVACLYVRR